MGSARKRIDLTKFIDRTVVCSKGARLGRIDELVVNVPDGRIEFVTLEIQSDRFEKRPRLRIPWSQFRLASDGKALQLNISLPVLEAVSLRRNQVR